MCVFRFLLPFRTSAYAQIGTADVSLPTVTPHMAKQQDATDLQLALRACKGSFLSVGFFSMFVNLLMLVPPLYMLQVYDRVITSKSEETLLMLTLVVVFLFMVMGGLELVRSRILVRVGNKLDTRINARLYSAMFRRSVSAQGRQSAQPLNDLTNLRQFLTGNGLFAFFDVPWVPVYLAALFLFHPWLGLFATFAGVVLLVLAISNEKATKSLMAEASNEQIKSQDLANSNLRNAEVLYAMGMLPGIMGRWAEKHHTFLAKQSRASDRAGALTNASKVLRMLFQSLILGLGALLVLENEMTPGHDDRRFDHHGACPQPHRPDDRQLERLCRSALRLWSSQRTADPDPRRPAAHVAARPPGRPDGGNRCRSAPWRSPCHDSWRRLQRPAR